MSCVGLVGGDVAGVAAVAGQGGAGLVQRRHLGAGLAVRPCERDDRIKILLPLFHIFLLAHQSLVRAHLTVLHHTVLYVASADQS